jgi:hypothetical protein
MDEEHRRQAEDVLKAMLRSAGPRAVRVSQSAARLLCERFELEPTIAAAGDGESSFELLGHRAPVASFPLPR